MRTGLCLSLAAPLFAAALGLAVPAAGASERAHVYADSFGNLVIESAGGEKRIVVGEGRLARETAAYVDAGRPAPGFPGRVAAGGDCYRPPVFVKGRSYMYGLSDGEMPELSPCR